MNEESAYRSEYTYSIYIGLKDKDSYKEYFTFNDIKSCLAEYCSGRDIAFSVTDIHGGYSHNKGYVTENSIKIEIAGADIQTVERIVSHFKKLVNTDTVMVTREKTEYRYI